VEACACLPVSRTLRNAFHCLIAVK
jgi:hypothetical protein